MTESIADSKIKTLMRRLQLFLADLNANATAHRACGYSDAEIMRKMGFTPESLLNAVRWRTPKKDVL